MVSSTHPIITWFTITLFYYKGVQWYDDYLEWNVDESNENRLNKINGC